MWGYDLQKLVMPHNWKNVLFRCCYIWKMIITQTSWHVRFYTLTLHIVLGYREIKKSSWFSTPLSIKVIDNKTKKIIFQAFIKCKLWKWNVQNIAQRNPKNNWMTWHELCHFNFNKFFVYLFVILVMSLLIKKVQWSSLKFWS